MATYYVRKNGSGTHTTIQGAIYSASNGDIIDIGEGTFNENIELYKSVVLQGAGKDVTILQGKLGNDVFAGCSWYAGESVINATSTVGMVPGRRISGSNLGTGSRISAVLSSTQFTVDVATTGALVKAGCSWSSGSSTITLPSATSVVVGMKVQGTGVEAFVTAYNTTTRVVTLSTPTTASGSNASLTFRALRSNVSITQPTQFSGSTFNGTIQVMGVASTGWQIKDMTINGFDGNTNSEAAAISITSPSTGIHQNWLIDGCKVVAYGDQAIASSPNLKSDGGTIQNCEFDGKTFTGLEPADIPAFSSFTAKGTIVKNDALEFTVSFSQMRGIVVGSTFTCPELSSMPVKAVQAVSGNEARLQAGFASGLSIGTELTFTFTNVQYCVPNVARQLVVIGNSGSVSACLNTTFKNNLVKGQTGAVISSSGSLNMFNAAVTIDTVGGLIEGNTLDGTYGAGVNSLVSNFAMRSRGAGVVVQNNISRITGGRENSGFYVPNGTSSNNTIVSKAMVNPSQLTTGAPVKMEIEKTDIKSLSKVSSDPVYSDEANWKFVVCVYKHKDSSKRLVSSFRDFAAQKEMKLKGSMVPGEEYQLHKIIITKADRSMLVLKRSEISNAASYDFVLK
jgi:hypothetical protein